VSAEHVDDFAIVFCTAGSRENAAAIATLLVERRLAACVQLTAIESCYRWNNAVQHEPEVLLSIKTRTERFAAVEACILEVHTYQLPEITMVPLTGGSAAYLRWIADSV
jgi:periplasmic divalent cation tolerance protein